jgi:hypothetical protein
MAFVFTGRAGRPSRAQRVTRRSTAYVHEFAKADRRMHARHAYFLGTELRTRVHEDQGRSPSVFWLSRCWWAKRLTTIDCVGASYIDGRSIIAARRTCLTFQCHAN